MICLTSARDRLLNVSIAINRPILHAVHIVYYLFLFSSASVLVYCIFLYVCIFFSFDATILVNKDVYIKITSRTQYTVTNLQL